MADALTFRALEYVLIGLFAFTVLILSVLSLRREIIAGKPLSGFIPVVLVIASCCAFIALLTAYVQVQRTASIMIP